jgi:hypothetical protein
MLKKDPRYKRLKGGGASWDGRTSYWLGPDHLLAVTVGRFAESYRRFYYADIQAVVLTRTRTQAWTLGIALVVLAFAGAGFVASYSAAAAQGWPDEAFPALVYAGLFSTLALVVAASELILGPTCECRLHTAVQVRALPGLKRWRASSRFVAQLDARVRDAQAGASGAAETGPGFGTTASGADAGAGSGPAPATEPGLAEPEQPPRDAP